ncbi:hypothetical protein LWI28_016408 [Acer negundo]|uniref:Uncharacterized protein n=1 Tax=Acer negundo TaxID=4023 RepID=A0AAD5IRH0_ACENE|nr:hypothetical protein LWI28_016408 [Acer negundo]
MGTRSNLYKNPSISYKKDLNLSSVLQNLKAYNIVTGNASPAEERPPTQERKPEPRLKRRRLSKPQQCRNGDETEDNDGPMKELSSMQSYGGLTADVLGTSSLGINLVGYESICSLVNIILECKDELLKSLKNAEEPSTSSNQIPHISSSGHECTLPLPEFEEEFWDYNHNHRSRKRSNLCTYVWKCRPWHLAEDCLMMASDQAALGQKKSNSISRDLIELYRRSSFMFMVATTFGVFIAQNYNVPNIKKLAGTGLLMAKLIKETYRKPKKTDRDD